MMIRWKSCLFYKRCKVFISDFGFKISGDLTKPGFIIIIIFWIQASMFKVLKSDWRASVSEPKKATKNFTIYLVTSFHVQ